MLDGDSAPPQKGGGAPPQFLAHVHCAKRLDGSKWHLAWRWALVEATLCQLPSQKGGGATSPIFGHCGQTVGCIKMPLGMNVGLSPGDFVRWGPRPPSPKRGRSPSILGLCLLWPNGWMDQDATCYGGRPRPVDIVRWGPNSPQMGTAPNFRPMSVVANSRPSQLLLSSC